MMIRRCDWCKKDYKGFQSPEIKLRYHGQYYRVEILVRAVEMFDFDSYPDICSGCRVKLVRDGEVT